MLACQSFYETLSNIFSEEYRSQDTEKVYCYTIVRVVDIYTSISYTSLITLIKRFVRDRSRITIASRTNNKEERTENREKIMEIH